MMTWHQRIGALALLVGGFASGCDGSATVSESSQGIAFAELPKVGGCAEVKLNRRSQIKVRPVAGVHDLFLVVADGKALCVDNQYQVDQLLGRAGSPAMPDDFEPSNPMPGTHVVPQRPGDRDANTDSNPMPGGSKGGG
jgi:hypothetical protein